MSRDGSGNYSLPAGQPVVSGQTISSTVHNTFASDVAAALTASIAKDGQTTPTANMPMGTFRHTGVGNPTARNQYATVDQVQDGDYNLVGSVSGTDTIAGSLAPSFTAYVPGMRVVLIPANANTGPATLNLNGVAGLDVQKYTSAGQVAIAAGDLRAGIPAFLILDTGGDDWILLNPYSGALGDVTVGTLTATTVNASGTVTGGNLTTAGTVTSATISNSGTATSDVVAATNTLTVAGQSARDATNLFNTGTVPAARLPGSFNGFANPSGTIGLTAVNGSAGTAMRSDGAPAVSQSIAPTWTGDHTFAGNGQVLITSGTPILQLFESDAAANNGKWLYAAAGEQLTFQAINDALNSSSNWLTVDRAGTTVDRVAFPTEGSGVFLVGTAPAAIFNASRMLVRGATAGVGAAQFNSSSTATTSTIYIQNEATSGDNVFATFITETGAGTVRGSIDFNRAGTLTRYNTTSDARLKTNIRESGSALELVMSIPVEAFDWIETGYHVEHGYVAQHLHKHFPDAVKTGDFWQVDRASLVPLLHRALQEVNDDLQRHKRRVAKALEALMAD